MLASQMNDEEFQHYAFSILRRELGPGGLARFLRLYRSGTGDYTRDRERWLADVSLSEIFAEMQTDRIA